MVQEVGETRDAIIEKDEEIIGKIVSTNQSRKTPYWIVLFAKPLKQTYQGKPILARHIKAYSSKPKSQVGMIIGKVDNSKGEISWETNMPQNPFDFDALRIFGAKPCDDVVIETTSLAGAYLTQ